MSGSAAFWVDEEDDRDRASDGVSRFGAYVRQSRLIAECWAEDWDNARARFAAAAWETATPPVMSPGYVRRHRRVLRARVEVSPWDATLNGVVDLAIPWPQPLAGSRDWRRGTWWRDWPAERRGGLEYYREPGEDESAAHAYLMATAALVFPLPAAGLPAAPSGPSGAEEAARDAVRVLVAAMDAVVAPVIWALERS